MKKTSLKDIAESLGVSKALVSLVMNGKGDERGINKETQEKVRRKAEELNYIPNQYARGLRMGRTNTIGVIVPDISNPFYAHLCKAIEMEASIKGYNIIICNTFEDTQKEKKLITDLINRNIDGLVLASSFDNKNEIESLKMDNFPIVLIDRVFDGLDFDSISVANLKGATKAIEFLYEKGVKRPACLTISPVYISSISERIKGYLTAVKDEKEAKLIQIRHNYIAQDMEKAGEEIIAKEYDGIFCVNNTIAKAFLIYLTKKGIDSSKFRIISFDDNEVFDIVEPNISSMCQPIQEIGRQAIEILVNRLVSEGTVKTQNLVLNTFLKER